MKRILLSLKSHSCTHILRGDQTVTCHKTRPKIDTPFRCYIYETLGRQRWSWLEVPKDQGGGEIQIKAHEGCGKVIGEFTCDHIERITDPTSWNYLWYLWYISGLKIYDTPKDLSDFYRECSLDKCEHCSHLQIENTPSSYETWCDCDERLPIIRPPQTWYYVFPKEDT